MNDALSDQNVLLQLSGENPLKLQCSSFKYSIKSTVVFQKLSRSRE